MDMTLWSGGTAAVEIISKPIKIKVSRLVGPRHGKHKNISQNTFKTQFQIKERLVQLYLLLLNRTQVNLFRLYKMMCPLGCSYTWSTTGMFNCTLQCCFTTLNLNGSQASNRCFTSIKQLALSNLLGHVEVLYGMWVHTFCSAHVCSSSNLFYFQHIPIRLGWYWFVLSILI